MSQIIDLDFFLNPNLKFDETIFPFSTLTHVLGGIGLYLLTIFVLHQWMQNRKPFSLKGIVPLHNFFLSALSLVMMLGMIFEITQIYFANSSLSVSGKCELFLCDQGKILASGRKVLWFYIFFLSKYYEFFDTVIIVLKKRPVIFLHVYHHCVTLLLVYVMLKTEVAVQWIAMVANTFVHIPMYYYYGMSSLGHNIWWKKYITKFQITQFVADIVGNSVGFYYIFTGEKCSGDTWAWVFGQSILASFLILFLSFYKTTYKKPAPTKKD